MKFWDSSAIVPLLIDEPTTSTMQALLEEDPELAVWWATQIECISALSRLERARKLTPERHAVGLDRFSALSNRWHEAEPTRELRELATRIVRAHPLRAADAAELAAALTLAENDPATLAFVSLDQRLREAAAREGFTRILPQPMS